MSLTLLVLGLNHTTAPVAVREQALAVCERNDLRTNLAQELNPQLFPESLFLSTCNRTEMYVVTTDAAHGARSLKNAFAWNEFGEELLHNAMYLHAGRDAATHLFRVAAGLDSLILGEFEILGQVRRAYQAANEQASVGPVLHQLFASALRLGKRARAETEIGSGALSIASAALTLLRRELGGLNGRTVLLVGTGEMGRRVAENLKEEQGCKVLVANRTLEHAAELAAMVHGAPIPFEGIPSALAQADLIVTATNAPHFILTSEMIAATRASKPPRPMHLLDLAMPRNVDPAAGALSGVRLFNLDDLDAIVAGTRVQRAQAIRAVEAMIADETDILMEWQQQRLVAPVIAELYAYGESIRDAELTKTLRRLQHLPLTERDRNVIAAMATGLVNKLLAAPTMQLKAHAGRENAQYYFDTVRELFDLPKDSSVLNNNHAQDHAD